jgi:hypothetical protein
MPDGKSLIIGGNDTERVSLWQQPLDGPRKDWTPVTRVRIPRSSWTWP